MKFSIIKFIHNQSIINWVQIPTNFMKNFVKYVNNGSIYLLTRGMKDGRFYLFSRMFGKGRFDIVYLFDEYVKFYLRFILLLRGFNKIVINFREEELYVAVIFDFIFYIVSFMVLIIVYA